MKKFILLFMSVLLLLTCATLTEEERLERREVKEMEEEIQDAWIRRCVLGGGRIEAVAATLNEKIRCVPRR